jgi:hypothetical protein
MSASRKIKNFVADRRLATISVLLARVKAARTLPAALKISHHVDATVASKKTLRTLSDPRPVDAV